MQLSQRAPQARYLETVFYTSASLNSHYNRVINQPACGAAPTTKTTHFHQWPRCSGLWIKFIKLEFLHSNKTRTQTWMRACASCKQGLRVMRRGEKKLSVLTVRFLLLFFFFLCDKWPQQADGGRTYRNIGEPLWLQDRSPGERVETRVRAGWSQAKSGNRWMHLEGRRSRETSSAASHQVSVRRHPSRVA